MGNKVLVINQVFWPDQHNTARQTSELSSELVKLGWDVTALTCNRSALNQRDKFSPGTGVWNGVKFIRVYVPPFNLKKNLQRLLASFWLIINWITWLPRIGPFNVIIVGTNPPFAYLIIPFLKLLKPKSKLILWGFDLYPEAIMVLGGKMWLVTGKLFKPITILCHRLLDVIVDIGPCMRNIYRTYKHNAKEVTLTPWSFIEPAKIPIPHPETRKQLFGDAKVALLYSGTIGNAHEFNNFLLLARELRKRKASVSFCFAGFGNRFEDLKKQVTSDDNNINFAGFVTSDKELEQRLSTADFMLISLKEAWTGISVPSKYSGAIAFGKAILFSGSRECSLSQWIEKYKIGLHLSEESIVNVADYLSEIEANPEILNQFRINAFNIYRAYFSKKVVCDGWHKLLSETINV